MLLLPGKAVTQVTLPAGDISAELLAAQKHLAQLQAKSSAERLAAGMPVKGNEHGRHLPPPSPMQMPTHLPAHLGWGSVVLTAVVRKTIPATHSQVDIEPLEAGIKKETSHTPSPAHLSPAPTETVKLYPDIAFGLFKQELTAPGRIWLLLRHLDGNGQGWLNLNQVRAQLTHKSSPWRVCGWRQLRNLLNQGEGIFWVRDNVCNRAGHVDDPTRLWLRSITNVAFTLGVTRLALPPVALPVSVLTESIGQVRAHLYASFHSSRAGKKDNGKPLSAPIARDTITTLTHIIPRTQRRYEHLARVQSKTNFAVGSKADAESVELTAWNHGRATFRLNDKKGLQGGESRSYIAWQLPNSYAGPHKCQPKGQQKQINQALSDLFMQGMTGNGRCHFERRFYGHGRAAAKAFNRQVNHSIYWYDGRVGVWYCLERPSHVSGRK